MAFVRRQLRLGGSSLTPSVSAAVTARPTRMPMAFVTTSIHVLVNSTSAASATDLAPSTSADALTSQKAIATVTATSLTPSVSAAVTARPTKMPMAFVTTSIHVLENSTSAASPTALAPSTSADVLTSPKAIATAKATSLTPSVSAAVTARPTKMPMAFVTTSMHVLENST